MIIDLACAPLPFIITTYYLKDCLNKMVLKISNFLFCPELFDDHARVFNLEETLIEKKEMETLKMGNQIQSSPGQSPTTSDPIIFLFS